MPYLMLSIQYRMHPLICQWPSVQFYNAHLMTAPDILPIQPLTRHGLARRPYAFYSISGQAETDDKSVFNPNEANYVTEIIKHLQRKGVTSKIGVITPYVAQRNLILQNLQRLGITERIEANTVDSFQGDERDVIIIFFARTHVTTFFQEYRRLNVALTRAKHCLIILGNTPMLKQHDIGRLIANAKQRNRLYQKLI